MINLISRAELARRAGVTPAAVTKACKNALIPAIVKTKINADHPVVVEYLSNRAPAPPKTRPVSGSESATLTKKTDRSPLYPPGTDPADNMPEDIRQYADWTLRDLMGRFGTDTYFVDWLKATKAIEDIHEKRLKNAEKSGELISRQLVKDGILDTLDGAFTRMLTDGAKTIAVRTAALVKGGAGPVEVEDLVASQLGTFIRPTKSKMARVLRNG